MEFQLEKFQPGDEEEILELLQSVFGGWPHFDLSCTPLEHWKWKHLDNPFSTQMIVKAVRESDHKIIGCYHGVDLVVKFGDAPYTVNNGVDLAVHPDCRRMGVYRKMNDMRMIMREKAGIKMSFWSTTNPIVMNNIQNPLTFEFPEAISHYVRVRNLDLHFNMVPIDKSWINKIGYRILDSIDKIRNLIKPQYASNKVVKIKKISLFDGRINEFWEEVSEDYSFMVERRQDYLNWRYCDPRGGDYHVCIAEEDNSIVGYSVCRINKYNQDYHRGYIVDLLTLIDRYDVSGALIHEAFEFFDTGNVNIVDCVAVRNSQLAKCLRRCGFHDSRKKLFVVSSPRGMTIDEKEKILHNISMKKVHFVYGDLDII